MIWLLGESEDTDLQWLAVSLQRRGVQVEYLLPDELMIGSSLSYRIDDLGAVSSLQLHDGRMLDDDMQGLVINRLTSIPPIGGTLGARDAAYLAEEWLAALVAWLRTLRCRVINPPRAGSLAGPVLLPAVWRRIAHAHGLSTHVWASAGEVDIESSGLAEANLPDPEPVVNPAFNTVDVVCLDQECFCAAGPIPQTVAQSLPQLAQFVGAPLLGARFTRELDDIGEQWRFVDASPYPRLACFGEPLVDAVLSLVTDTSRTSYAQRGNTLAGNTQPGTMQPGHTQTERVAL